MSSHVHKVGVGDELPLGSFLHSLNTSFGAWLNKYEGGFGKVFAERPSSHPIDDVEGFANSIAYTHNNPCRAGLVNCPSQSDWTSHLIYIGEVPEPDYMDVKWSLAQMGFSASPSGRLAFHDFVVSRSGLPRDPSLAGRAPSDVEVAKRLLESSAAHFGISPEELARPCCQENRMRRLELVSVAKLTFGLTNRHLAETLGVSEPLLSRLSKRAAGSTDSRLELLNSFLWFEKDE